MNRQEFADLVSLLGAEISSWPEEERVAAEKAMQNNPRLSDILRDEQRFEAVARMRPKLQDNPAFPCCIINAARNMKTSCKYCGWRVSLRQFAQDFLTLFPLPHPAYVLMGLAIIGYLSGAVMQPKATTTVLGALETNSDLFSYDTQVLI